MAMIRLLGFGASVDMATRMHKEATQRKRTMRREAPNASSAAVVPFVLEGSTQLATTVHKPSLNDFVLLRVLGKGNFGKVRR